MVLRLPEEIEQGVRQRAAARGVTPEVIVAEAIEAKWAAERLPQSPSTPADPSSLPYEQWATEFRQWVGAHAPLPYEADDSRQTIYEDRGL